MHEYELMLKEIRKSRGLTQDELAEKLGVTKQIVSNWEREITPINLEYAIKSAKVLNCTLDELAGWEATKEQHENEKQIDALIAQCHSRADDWLSLCRLCCSHIG